MNAVFTRKTRSLIAALIAAVLTAGAPGLQGYQAFAAMAAKSPLMAARSNAVAPRPGLAPSAIRQAGRSSAVAAGAARVQAAKSVAQKAKALQGHLAAAADAKSADPRKTGREIQAILEGRRASASGGAVAAASGAVQSNRAAALVLSVKSHLASAVSGIERMRKGYVGSEIYAHNSILESVRESLGELKRLLTRRGTPNEVREKGQRLVLKAAKSTKSDYYKQELLSIVDRAAKAGKAAVLAVVAAAAVLVNPAKALEVEPLKFGFYALEPRHAITGMPLNPYAAVGVHGAATRGNPHPWGVEVGVGVERFAKPYNFYGIHGTEWDIKLPIMVGVTKQIHSGLDFAFGPKFVNKNVGAYAGVNFKFSSLFKVRRQIKDGTYDWKRYYQENPEAYRQWQRENQRRGR